MNFREAIDKFVTCEVHYNGSVKYFAKLASGKWVAVMDGELDDFEIRPEDFESMLDSLEGIGATVRFTNHSAA